MLLPEAVLGVEVHSVTGVTVEGLSAGLIAGGDLAFKAAVGDHGVEMDREVLIVQESRREIVEGRWAQVFHVISILKLVAVFPVLVNSVRNADVEEVGFDLYGQHGSFIDVEDSEAGVDGTPGGDRASPVVHSHRLGGVEAPRNTIVLVVHVTPYGETDDVLESFTDGSEADGPLIQGGTSTRGNVRDDDSYLSILLHLVQEVAQPLELISRVFSSRPQIEVKLVHGLGGHSNHSHFLVVSSIAESQSLTVVAGLFVGLLGLLIQIALPLLQVEVDHRILLIEILAVGGTKVVVSFQWIHRELAEVFLHVVGQILLISLNVFSVVVPHIMGRNISSPENDIGLDLITDIFKHELKGLGGKIAAVLSVLTSSLALVGGISTVGSAAQDLITPLVRAWLIFEIQVKISKLEHSDSISVVRILSDLFVEVVNEVVVLDNVRLVSKHVVDVSLIILFCVVRFGANRESLGAEEVGADGEGHGLSDDDRAKTVNESCADILVQEEATAELQDGKQIGLDSLVHENVVNEANTSRAHFAFKEVDEGASKILGFVVHTGEVGVEVLFDILDPHFIVFDLLLEELLPAQLARNELVGGSARYECQGANELNDLFISHSKKNYKFIWDLFLLTYFAF